MQQICLDTDIIINFLRDNKDYKDLFKKIENKKIEGYISSATSFELYSGAFLAKKSKEEFSKIRGLLNWFEIIDINEHVSFITAKIFSDLRKKGKPQEIRDLLIAACAISRNLSLATKNRNHFKDIRGLVII